MPLLKPHLLQTRQSQNNLHAFLDIELRASTNMVGALFISPSARVAWWY